MAGHRLLRSTLTITAAAPLLGDAAPAAPTHANPSDQLSIRDLLSTPALRRPALLVTAVLSLQQFSGVNAVLFYSTPVLLALSRPGDTSAGAISIAITVVNAIMTLPAVYLVDVSEACPCRTNPPSASAVVSSSCGRSSEWAL